MSAMNPERLEMAEKLASRDYSVIISQDKLTNGQTVFLLEHPELDGCMGQGATIDEALVELKEATVEFIYYLLEDGFEVPEPVNEETVTGLDDVQYHDNFIITSGWQMTDERLSEDVINDDLDQGMQTEPRKSSMRFSVVTKS